MKIKDGDLVLIPETNTLGFVQHINSSGEFSIRILEHGTSSKTAWYNQNEGIMLISMEQSLAKAKEMVNSPLFKALSES